MAQEEGNMTRLLSDRADHPRHQASPALSLDRPGSQPAADPETVLGRRRGRALRAPAAGAALAASVAGALLLAVLVLAMGCQGHFGAPDKRDAGLQGSSADSSSSASSSAPSEAQRTRDMESKAQDLQKQANDIQSSNGTEQEKIDAANKFEQQRQQLDQPAAGGEGGQQPSPPPPAP